MSLCSIMPVPWARKILISGGGRCNFTNIGTIANRFICTNPHFVKSALSRYTPQDFIDLVDRHGIAWHEKTLGQLFCDSSARQIVAMLLAECEQGNVTVKLDHEIGSVEHHDGLFRVATSQGIYQAANLVIATGGPSIPKLGATDFAYRLARQFGLKIVEPRPALVPFTLGGHEVLFRELSGIATNTVVQCGKQQFREASLFTHKGLSGPAMLQISSYWHPGQSIGVDFIPDQEQGWLLKLKASTPGVSLNKVFEHTSAGAAGRSVGVAAGPAAEPVSNFRQGADCCRTTVAPVAVQPKRHRRLCQGRSDGWGHINR